MLNYDLKVSPNSRECRDYKVDKITDCGLLKQFVHLTTAYIISCPYLPL